MSWAGAAAAAVIPAVTRLSSSVTRLLGFNPSAMTLQGTNTYLVGTGNKRILIDTGDENVPKYVESLTNVVREENIDIAHVVITHWHHDHIGGVKDIFPNLSADCKIWKYPKGEGEIDDELPESIKVNWLKDGQIMKVEGATLEVCHTPGHTTDHIILSLKEETAVFSGDCILGEGTAVFEDLYHYMLSLQKILDIRPKIIYPGHGNVIQDPIERIEYYIKHRNERERQILQVLKENSEPLTDMQIVENIYTETPKNLWPAACFNVNHHLQKLLKENKISSKTIDGETKWSYKNNSLL